MAELSRFYGIVITMFSNDHAPPHFHVFYGEFRASVPIDDGFVVGKLPPRALALVNEWRSVHRDALLQNWKKAQNHCRLNRIPPLP
jgi:hypothetical protein